MSEKQEAKQEVTLQDLELAAQVIAEWHKQKNLAFALVNSGTGLVMSGGNAFELEAALNHAHKMLEFDNGSRLMQIKQINEARQQGAESSEG